jgi:hypothetical protein
VEELDMGTSQMRIVVIGVLFLIVFILGLWLSHSGKPYNVFFLTFHKLISLAALVYLIVVVLRFNKSGRLNTVELLAAGLCGLFFLISIISGGLVSAEKDMPEIFNTIHWVAPFLTLLSASITLYLLLKRNVP